MPDELNVKKRTETGTRNCRRIRQQGLIPATMYGHGEQSVSLAIPAVEVNTAIRHGSQLVSVVGDFTDSALIREVQWDALGSEILHVDLTRVSADERVEVQVSVEIRGIAPGTSEGGVIEHVTHELAISCPARSIPEKLVVSVNELHLGQSIVTGDLEIPEGASLLASDDLVIVTCNEPVAALDEDVLSALPGEPEVIGRKPEEEDGGDG